MKSILSLGIVLLVAGLVGFFFWQQRSLSRTADLDQALQTLIREQGLTPLTTAAAQDPNKVALGAALFFDKELSGNRDISCATCHHPQLATADALPLSIGTGSTGFGADRQLGLNRKFVSRHATDLFNRGHPDWETMFWEGRVSGNPFDGFQTPAGAYLPAGLDNVLAAQAMFPVTIRNEMRGGWYNVAGYAIDPGTSPEDDAYQTPSGFEDVDVFGQPNELAAIPNESEYFPQIWDLLVQRLLAIPAYQQLFSAAYPDVSQAELGFEHAANALAAYEIEAFTFTNSAWDRYLAGDQAALTTEAKAGALLFYGEAGCHTCHSGPLLTDQAYHNIGTPQFGPGRDDIAPLDYGRFAITNDPADRFAFRTPPLRNVAETGPWLHNGAYDSLFAVIQHHLTPAASLTAYDGRQLSPDLQETLQNHPVTTADILDTLSSQLPPDNDLTPQQINQLIAFLESLTDPAVAGMARLIPESVPSGLPISEN